MIANKKQFMKTRVFLQAPHATRGLGNITGGGHGKAFAKREDCIWLCFQRKEGLSALVHPIPDLRSRFGEDSQGSRKNKELV